MLKGFSPFGKFTAKADDFIEKVHSFDVFGKTDEELKEQLRASDDIAIRAAVIKEIIFRLMGLKLFDSQLKTAYALFHGQVAELPTGEGKTLAAVLAAVLFVLDGRKVNILVFNDYLAKRDGTDNGKIFDFCGISCSHVTQKTTIEQRKSAYLADVVYISAKEAGFDYLKNYLCMSKEELTPQSFDVAIIDEADSILIDEASIPLVLAGSAEQGEGNSEGANQAVLLLDEQDVEVNRAENQVWLTDSGVSRIEEYFTIENLYSDENIKTLAAVNMALEANFLLKRDQDYIIKDGTVQVVDESTGRIAVNRKFPDALQRAVEVKENVTANNNTKIYNTITIQSFLALYKTVCGMTGTAKSSSKELFSMYELEVTVVEPHTPCIRIDHPDKVFQTAAAKSEAVLATIKNSHSKGQPVLIGTASVEESEWYSNKLTEMGIAHTVLNARNDEQEAEIIAMAGEPYRVTVSTNMAGRGVDIKLGGKNEEKKVEVIEAHGLLVIGVGINKSLRIDNQLRGRAGRQGDPGESQFFVSLQDANVEPFIKNEDTGKKTKPLTDKQLAEFVRDAQRTLEGNEAEARYMLRKYSYILEHQRELMSKYREDLLFDRKKSDVLERLDPELFENLCETVSLTGVEIAQKQLVLYYSNQHFADYLETMDDVRNGIHLTMVAGKNPLDEYNRTAISAFEEMQTDIENDVLEGMQTYTITENGIDMLAEGLGGATTTWTYMIDDSSSQFNRIPELMNLVSNKIKKSVFSLSDMLDKRLNKNK